MIPVTKTSDQTRQVCVFSSHSFWTSSSLDVPAGVTVLPILYYLLLLHTYILQVPLLLLPRSPRWFSWQPRSLLALGREFETRCSHTNRDFSSQKKKKKKKKMPNGWRTIKSLVRKIRLHGPRGKGTAESFSR